MKSVLIVSHGSRSKKTERELEALTDGIRQLCQDYDIAYAFLELNQPSIPDGIDGCVARGAKDILVLLNFLNSGRHVDVDIPGIVDEARNRYPGVKFSITAPVGQHDQIRYLFRDMIQESFASPSNGE